MRAFITCAFIFIFALPGLSQTNVSAAPVLPKDPRAVFAAAAPFYDFTDATLKPWHLKATYQLYDEKGNPAEQGTYEYWWVSPHVYRNTWTRPNATHTDWHTAEGTHAYLATGERLKYLEYKLQSALLSPLPDAEDLDPAKTRLDREMVSAGGSKMPCIMVIPLMPQHGQTQAVPLGLFPTYCFDSRLPVLRVTNSMGNVAMEYDKIVKVQNRYLAREIVFYEGKHKILSATVDTIGGLAPSDPALTPPPATSVTKLDKVNLSGALAVGNLIKKETPVYPQDAIDAHISGLVILKATIGMDGGIHDLRVVSTPWPSLAASALWAVSRWEYKPYMLNGDPVEVETTVNVTYTLERN